MPYGTLYDIVKMSKNGRLSEDIAKIYTAEIISFLKMAHNEVGIVHGYLNPKAIFVYQNQHLRLMNFRKSRFIGNKAHLNVMKEDDGHQHFT